MNLFKDLGLKTKMMVGSLGPLVLVVILGVVVYTSINSLLQSSHMVDHTHSVIQEAMKIEGAAVDMETGMRGYLLAGKDGFLDPYTNGGKRFDVLVAGLQKTVSDNPAQVQRLNDIRDNIKAWQTDVTEPTIALRREIGQSKTMDDMRDLVRQKKGKVYMDDLRAKIATFIGREEKLMNERKEAAKHVMDVGQLRETFQWVDHTHEVIGLAGAMLAAAVDMETGMRGYLLAGEEEFLDPYKGGIERFGITLSTLKNTVSDNPAQVALLEEIDKTCTEWQKNVTESAIALRREIGMAKSMNDMAALVGEARGKKYFDKFRGQIKTFIETEDSLMGTRQEEAKKTAGSSQNMVLFGTFLTILIAGVISYFLANAITRAFKSIFQGLKSLSSRELDNVRNQFKGIIETLNSGAEQVASASQQMASGASQQASNLEETSSSLEEMSSMTRQNADNAKQANGLMTEANQIVEQANGSMKALTDSMTEISTASEETSKIIKTIDEIAFQTNLLALNAAVEAARAGEAGAGFAVVADEVRNLAMRAADAAKNTADLIEETVKKVNGGSDLVAKTNDAFTEVSTSASKVGELVSEIAAASDEQAQGIGQVNTAVAEMDKVVQSNAAATEELSSQSEELNGQVGLLLGIVEGNKSNGAGGVSAQAYSENRPEARLSSPQKQIAAPKNDIDPEAVIPLEGDFKDF